MKHISIRVPWHDDLWNGAVCRSPKNNPFCLCLKRIQAEKDVDKEQGNAGKLFSEIDSENHPPCLNENAGFLSDKAFSHTYVHPYKDEAHSKLKPTTIEIPPYSCMATPFWYFSNSNQQELEKKCLLSPDEKAGFNTAWVYGSKRLYDILIHLRDKNNFEYGEDMEINGIIVNEKCKTLAHKIREILDTKSSFADWINNSNFRKELKYDIKICLVKNGYPPQYSPEVFREVMEQVENFKENEDYEEHTVQMYAYEGESETNMAAETIER